MKINVASLNSVKVGAVKETIQDYAFLKDASVVGVETQSGVSDQPKSIEEVIRGARNRAKSAFKDCDLSFGIESGLMQVPYTKTGFMDFCACVIFDGDKFHVGLSSAWECPIKINELIHGENLDMNQAVVKLGLSKDPKIGSSEGLIGLMTKNRVTRKEYTKQSIKMALIHLENKELY